MAAVLGPDRRGVIFLTDSGDVSGLVDVPATTLAAAGLSTSGSSDAASVAVAVRRPAAQRDEDGWAVADAGGELRRGPDVAALVREACARPAPPRVAVFGGAWIREDEPEYEEIRRVGRWVAEQGAHLVCGGYQGAMAAAARGVSEAGGSAVGVTIDEWGGVVTVNRWLTHELVARDLFARLPVITDADAWVAFPGGVGTLQEVALCWNLVQTSLARARPLLLVGEAWDRQLGLFRELLRVSDPAHFDLVQPMASADDVTAALEPVIG